MRRKEMVAVVLSGTMVASLFVGCGGGDGAADVAGEVTLDGKPIEEGVIHFMPVDGKSRTASTFIRGGHFQARVPLGKHRVEISSVQARPLRPGQDADSATGAEVVPARYNTKSELRAEVVPGRNEPRFELSAK
jgi:hypothetical protein